jgi:hypothetical protein
MLYQSAMEVKKMNETFKVNAYLVAYHKLIKDHYSHDGHLIPATWTMGQSPPSLTRNPRMLLGASRTVQTARS